MGLRKGIERDKGESEELHLQRVSYIHVTSFLHVPQPPLHFPFGIPLGAVHHHHNTTTITSSSTSDALSLVPLIMLPGSGRDPTLPGNAADGHPPAAPYRVYRIPTM